MQLKSFYFPLLVTNTLLLKKQILTFRLYKDTKTEKDFTYLWAVLPPHAWNSFSSAHLQISKKDHNNFKQLFATATNKAGKEISIYLQMWKISFRVWIVVRIRCYTFQCLTWSLGKNDHKPCKISLIMIQFRAWSATFLWVAQGSVFIKEGSIITGSYGALYCNWTLILHFNIVQYCDSHEKQLTLQLKHFNNGGSNIQNNRPYLYSWHCSGTSLQWRPMQWNIIKD